MDVNPVNSSGDVWNVFGNFRCLIENFFLKSKKVSECSIAKINFNGVVEKNRGPENGVVKKQGKKLGIVLCSDLLLNERIEVIVVIHPIWESDGLPSTFCFVFPTKSVIPIRISDIIPRVTHGDDFVQSSFVIFVFIQNDWLIKANLDMQPKKTYISRK